MFPPHANSVHNAAFSKSTRKDKRGRMCHLGPSRNSCQEISFQQGSIGRVADPPLQSAKNCLNNQPPEGSAMTLKTNSKWRNIYSTKPTKLSNTARVWSLSQDCSILPCPVEARQAPHCCGQAHGAPSPFPSSGLKALFLWGGGCESLSFHPQLLLLGMSPGQM